MRARPSKRDRAQFFRSRANQTETVELAKTIKTGIYCQLQQDDKTSGANAKEAESNCSDLRE